jgi:nucleoid DNA-binding protein
MKQDKLTRTLARETHQSSGQARDEIDALVHRILKSLRRGRSVDLPGVGKLIPQKSFQASQKDRR